MRPALYTNIQRFSIHDGGGIRTVVFLKGCPFKCPWCCNPENLSFVPDEEWHERLCIGCSMVGESCAANCPRTAEECPTAAKEIVGKPAVVEELVNLALRDRVFHQESNGGVTLSGGECLAGPNQAFAMDFLERCHEQGINTAIESTLAVPLADPERLARSCDTFLIDFKIADREESRRVLGLDPDVRDRNLRELISLGANAIARMPIIPGFTDGEDTVAANVARIRELGISRADVLPFHQLGSSKYDALGWDYDMGEVPQLSEDDVIGVVATCEAAGLVTVVHGE